MYSEQCLVDRMFSNVSYFSFFPYILIKHLQYTRPTVDIRYTKVSLNMVLALQEGQAVNNKHTFMKSQFDKHPLGRKQTIQQTLLGQKDQEKSLSKNTAFIHTLDANQELMTQGGTGCKSSRQKGLHWSLVYPLRSLQQCGDRATSTILQQLSISIYLIPL